MNSEQTPEPPPGFAFYGELPLKWYPPEFKAPANYLPGCMTQSLVHAPPHLQVLLKDIAVYLPRYVNGAEGIGEERVGPWFIGGFMGFGEHEKVALRLDTEMARMNGLAEQSIEVTHEF